MRLILHQRRYYQQQSLACCSVAVMTNRIQELVGPLRRQDFPALLRTVRDDLGVVVRHLLNRQDRVLPEHALETAPTPTQIEEIVGELFPEVPPDERLTYYLARHF